MPGKEFSRNKLRSLLTMLGVIIGVAAVIIMIAVSAGTEATIADQINSLGANLIFVQPDSSVRHPRRRRQTAAAGWSMTMPTPLPS